MGDRSINSHNERYISFAPVSACSESPGDRMNFGSLHKRKKGNLAILFQSPHSSQCCWVHLRPAHMNLLCLPIYADVLTVNAKKKKIPLLRFCTYFCMVAYCLNLSVLEETHKTESKKEKKKIEHFFGVYRWTCTMFGWHNHTQAYPLRWWLCVDPGLMDLWQQPPALATHTQTDFGLWVSLFDWWHGRTTCVCNAKPKLK